MKNTIATLCLALLLTGCNTMKLEDFSDTQPVFVLEDYFAGETRAWGIFEDRFGNLRRQFVVDINGTWQGGVLTLDERFVYSDGETDRRVWRITKTGPGAYEGTADDLVGTAEGRARGNALSWRYSMDLKVGDGSWRVQFDDWMFLQPDGILINRARVSKWGFELGAVTLFFSKDPARTAAWQAPTLKVISE
jgi:hypothetical protein